MTVALAGLLHDVGSLARRAQPHTALADSASQSDHAELGRRFWLEHLAPHTAGWLGEPDRALIAELIANHHRPRGPLAELLARADSLAGSHPGLCVDVREEEPAHAVQGLVGPRLSAGSPNPVAPGADWLLCPLCREADVAAGVPDPEPWVLRPSVLPEPGGGLALAGDEMPLPAGALAELVGSAGSLSPGSPTAGFVAAWSALQAGAAQLAEPRFRTCPQAFVSGLLGLLDRTTGTVATARGRLELGVSLADHLRWTAALAGAMYQLVVESQPLDAGFRLVGLRLAEGADVSGVRSAAVPIAGRRRHEWAFLTAAEAFLGRELCVLPTAVIRRTGRESALLLADSPGVRSRLAELGDTLARAARASFGVGRTVQWASVPVSAVKLPGFAPVYRELQDAWDANGRRPMMSSWTDTEMWEPRLLLRQAQTSSTGLYAGVEAIAPDEELCRRLEQEPPQARIEVSFPSLSQTVSVPGLDLAGVPTDAAVLVIAADRTEIDAEPSPASADPPALLTSIGRRWELFFGELAPAVVRDTGGAVLSVEGRNLTAAVPPGRAADLLARLQNEFSRLVGGRDVQWSQNGDHPMAHYESMGPDLGTSQGGGYSAATSLGEGSIDGQLAGRSSQPVGLTAAVATAALVEELPARIRIAEAAVWAVRSSRYEAINRHSGKAAGAYSAHVWLDRQWLGWSEFYDLLTLSEELLVTPIREGRLSSYLLAELERSGGRRSGRVVRSGRRSRGGRRRGLRESRLARPSPRLLMALLASSSESALVRRLARRFEQIGPQRVTAARLAMLSLADATPATGSIRVGPSKTLASAPVEVPRSGPDSRSATDPRTRIELPADSEVPA